jgi:hypothetical protein
MKYTNTLLPRFYGLYTVRMGASKITFLITENIFFNESNFSMHETYDLKVHHNQTYLTF